jgi:CRP-like cAMP-binding protein
MIELLEESTLFGGCTREHLETVAACCMRRSYPARATIFEAHTPADSLYVVERGAVELHVGLHCYGATQELTVDRKLRGDVVGWSSLLAAHTFTLSATAVRDTTLVRIRTADLDELFTDDRFGHVVMRRLAEIIAQRFDVMQRMLIDMLQDRIAR